MNIEENKVYGGDKYDRTDVYEYGNLLAMIDDARNKIDYNKNIYTAELNGIGKRRNSLKTNVTYNIGFFVIWILISIIIRGMIAFGMNVHPIQLVAAIIAIVGIIAGYIYMVIRIIKAVILYRINVSADFMSGYVRRKGLHTMVEEEEYCGKVLKQMLEYESAITKMEKGVKEKSIDPEPAMDEITRMNFDIPDFKYNAGHSGK